MAPPFDFWRFLTVPLSLIEILSAMNVQEVVYASYVQFDLSIDRNNSQQYAVVGPK
jgi:hypothetical protein